MLFCCFVQLLFLDSKNWIVAMNDSLEVEPSLSRYYVEQTQYYVIPFLITFGILGNSLSGYVILKTKLRQLSSSIYLLALSSNDSVMLITIGIQWLSQNDIDLYNQPILCQVITYVSDLCASMTVWLIVVFTGERFMVVKYPLRAKFLCTVRRAQLIIIILFITMLIFYSPLLFIAGLEFSNHANRTVCKPKKEWHRVGVIFNSFDFILTCIIPVLIISVLNSIICQKVWKFTNLRRKMTDDFQMNNLTRGTHVVNHLSVKADKTSYKMTKMLLVVSTVCLCLILPSFIMRFIVHLNTVSTYI